MGFFDFFKFSSSRFASTAVSEKGPNRADNQDHFYADDERGIYCVADGLGGASDGAKASEIVCSNLKVMSPGAGDDLMERVSSVFASFQESNSLIREYSAEKGYGNMGSTVAALVFDPKNKYRAATIWAGDSRVYRIRGGRAEMFTHDHRFGFSNSLTRAIGVNDELKCDMKELSLKKGDRLLLCTDGVSGVVTDRIMAAIITDSSITKAAELLTKRILKLGAPDNFTFIIVEI